MRFIRRRGLRLLTQTACPQSILWLMSLLDKVVTCDEVESLERESGDDVVEQRE